MSTCHPRSTATPGAPLARSAAPSVAQASTTRTLALLAALALAASACADNQTPWSSTGGASTALCLPDLDGRIDAHELRARLDVAGRYRVAEGTDTTAVDVVGAVDGSGRLSWDWRGATAGAVREVRATAAADGWYGAEVPAAELALPLDGDADLVGLYREDGAGLWLLAIASRLPGPARGRTLLRYAAPVPALRFPLRRGAAWQADVATAGELDGLPWQGSDHWSVVVDGEGRMELPDLGAGPALRVRTRVEVRSALGPTAARGQISVYFECLGELGRAVYDDIGADLSWPERAPTRIWSLVP